MLDDYNIYYNEKLIATVRSTDEQSAIKTAWMRNSHSASRYSCWNLDDLKAEKAGNSYD